MLVGRSSIEEREKGEEREEETEEETEEADGYVDGVGVIAPVMLLIVLIAGVGSLMTLMANGSFSICGGAGFRFTCGV